MGFKSGVARELRTFPDPQFKELEGNSAQLGEIDDKIVSGIGGLARNDSRSMRNLDQKQKLSVYNKNALKKINK